MRVGVLGGSFNPVHIGHLRLALEALAVEHLDRVELVPAAVPPHKQNEILMPFSKRCELLEAATHSIPELVVNPLEGQRQGPSYTVYTLRVFHASVAPEELFFLLGCGDFLTLPHWYAWEDLLQLTNFCVVGRNGEGREALRSFVEDHCQAKPLAEDLWQLPGASRRVRFLPIPRLDVSSSLIRRYLRHDRSIRFLVPDCVVEVLEQGMQ